MFSEVMLWLGVIVGLGILLAVIATYLRRRLTTQEEQPIGFTLGDLREMHARGELSDEELDRAERRTAALSRSRYLGESAVQQGTEGEEVEDLGDITPDDDPPNVAQPEK